MADVSKIEATLSRPDGTVKRLFAGRGKADAAEWFRSSYRDETGARPSFDEEKRFTDGHDVTAFGMTWRLKNTGPSESVREDAAQSDT